MDKAGRHSEKFRNGASPAMKATEGQILTFISSFSDMLTDVTMIISGNNHAPLPVTRLNAIEIPIPVVAAFS